jgi:hypothetical protein
MEQKFIALDQVSHLVAKIKLYVADYVAAHAGSGGLSTEQVQALITAALAALSVSDFANDAGYQTATDVDTAITAALADKINLHFVPVDALPDIADADETAIYLVPSAADDGSKDEWIAIAGAWEQLGTTAVDLSGYLRAEDLQFASNEDIDALFTGAQA